jgi:hypothetical protein
VVVFFSLCETSSSFYLLRPFHRVVLRTRENGLLQARRTAASRRNKWISESEKRDRRRGGGTEFALFPCNDLLRRYEIHNDGREAA